MSEDIPIELTQMHHDDSLTDHYGSEMTLELLMRNYYFPGIFKHIRKCVASCDICSQGKLPRHFRHWQTVSVTCSLRFLKRQFLQPHYGSSIVKQL